VLKRCVQRPGTTCADHYGRWQEGFPLEMCIHQEGTMELLAARPEERPTMKVEY
jgi:hypothetical protein